MQKRFRCIWLAAIAAMLAGTPWVDAWSATTGKIEGVVRDGRTGEPLPGANVAIDGTRRGATTDANGVYVILRVEPGMYALTSSLVGYDAQRQTDVRVHADLTTAIHFQIREAALALGEIAVVAERPAIEFDRTTTLYITAAEDIEALPILRSAYEFIELQAGVQVDQRGDDLLIRGGNPRDVGYYVDGVRIASTDHRDGTRVWRDVNTSAIQEMTVITGGMNAEYGNAQGSVVNFVTREGGARFSVMANYQFIPAGRKHWGANAYEAPMHRANIQWDDPEWVAEPFALPDGTTVLAHRRQPYTEKTGHQVEGNLGGPLARNATFFATSRYRRTASAVPSAHLVTPFNTNNTLRLTSALSPNLKISLSGLYDRRKGSNDGPRIGGQLNMDEDGRNIFMVVPNPSGRHVIADALISAQITHALSPRTFYELRLSLSTSSRDTLNVSLPAGIAHLSEAASGHVVKDRSGYFNLYRDVVNFQRYDYRRIILKGDLSSQVNRQHFVKTGFEMIAYNNWEMGYWSDQGPNHRVIRWMSRDIRSMDFWPGQQKNEGVRPVQIGVYAQDKIEHEGMIVNAGIRGDLFFQREYVTDVDPFLGGASPMWTRMSRQGHAGMPTVVGPTMKSISPRVGISHPLTASAMIRFFYGRLTQFPSFQTLYPHHFQSLAGGDRDLNQNGVIDSGERWNTFEPRTGPSHNAFLPPEETTSFELGLEWNFVGDYVAGLSTYYKSSGNEPEPSLQTFKSPSQGHPFIAWTRGWATGGYRDVRGIELSLRKRFSQMFAFTLAYNHQMHEVGWTSVWRRDAFPDSLFVAHGHYWVDWDIDPTTGREIPVSLTEKARREGRANVNHYVELWGRSAQNHLRTWQTTYVDTYSQWSWIPWRSRFSAEGTQIRHATETHSTGDWLGAEHYGDWHREYWERVNAHPDYPGFGEANILVAGFQDTEARATDASDRRGFGSLTFLFATPSDFGPGNGSLFGHVRANLVYRMYMGTTFFVGSVYAAGGMDAGAEQMRSGPMVTRTDMNLEKSFRMGRRNQLTLALEVYNLFNDRDVRMVGSGPARNVDFNGVRWARFGIQGLDPTDASWQWGERNDINNYHDAPRELRFSARIHW